MIKRSTFVASAIVLCAGVATAAFAPGCGGSEEAPATTTPGGGAYTSRKPPGRPTATATGATKWFEIKSLKLGLTNKATGMNDPQAWKDYGFDLDSRNTLSTDSRDSINSCKRIAGSSTGVLKDGTDGIDNNFGQHVMQVIKSLKSDAEDSVNASIAVDKAFTLLLKIDNFTTGDNSKAAGAVYVGNDFKDGKWQIVAGSLLDGASVNKPKLTFPNGYIAGGYWVSGDFGKENIELDISLSGATIKLPIGSGVITMKTDGTDGTIAGAMNTTELKEALTPVARRFGICPGNATFDQVVDTLTQSADLVTGAPNLQDTTKQCNAISIALGFVAGASTDHSTATVKVTDGPTGPDECDTDGGVTDTGAKADTGAATDSASGG